MIGNALWSIVDVWSSVIINRVHKNPIVIAWYFALIDLVLLAGLSLFFRPGSAWAVALSLSAASAFLGTMAFLTLLSKVDASISSTAWISLSIGIAAGGFFFFDDTWSVYQTIGAILSVAGALWLVIWSSESAHIRTSILTLLVGLLYVPYFLVSKAALLQGVPPLSVMFWYLLFHALFALCIPLLVSSWREGVMRFGSRLSTRMVLWFVLRAVLIFTATYVVILAYNTGQASLVGIAENGQPFFLLFFAWIATYLFPQYAPRELLTKASVSVKVITFFIVFVGLGLLTVG